MIKTFSELSVTNLLKNNLARRKFITPTPIQAAALEPALEGKDVLGTAQTGTGKTLAFLVPIVERLMKEKNNEIQALVLLPTRELAMQVLETLRDIGTGTGILPVLVVGGLSEYSQIQSIRKGANFVIATPGRLDDYVKRKLVNLKSVKILVLDEADRMVDMGFLPQMKNIMNVIPKDRQTMCFSATLDKSVAHMVREYLKNPVHVEIGETTKTADRVHLKIYEVARTQKFELLCYLLEKHAGTYLVFTRTKYGAEKLSKKLVQRGFNSESIHGDKSQSQRTRALEGFKSGKHRVLVATDVAARGIHVNGIAHVINFDMPQAKEDFIHRVGRTGRVEETGTATTFVMPDERYDIQTIERSLGKKIERLPLPDGLPSEPRSLHDEAADMRGRKAPRGPSFVGRRHFGRKRY